MRKFAKSERVIERYYSAYAKCGELLDLKAEEIPPFRHLRGLANKPQPGFQRGAVIEAWPARQNLGEGTEAHV